jgi:hypothetical protein
MGVYQSLLRPHKLVTIGMTGDEGDAVLIVFNLPALDFCGHSQGTQLMYIGLPLVLYSMYYLDREHS